MTLDGNGTNLYQTWRDIIEFYSQCNLTYDTDRLPALSGLATRFKNLSDDVYLAGMWKSQLQTELEWEVLVPPSHTRPVAYVGPSWS